MPSSHMQPALATSKEKAPKKGKKQHELVTFGQMNIRCPASMEYKPEVLKQQETSKFAFLNMALKPPSQGTKEEEMDEWEKAFNPKQRKKAKYANKSRV